MIESHPYRDQWMIDKTVQDWTKAGWTCEVIAHTNPSDGGTYWTVKGTKRVVEDKRQVG